MKTLRTLATAAVALTMVAGATCAPCATESADTCSAAGECLCGSSPACDTGQRCQMTTHGDRVDTSGYRLQGQAYGLAQEAPGTGKNQQC